MATRESEAARGERRSRLLRHRTSEELGGTRRAIGLSLREISRKLDVSVDRLIRVERGEAATLTVDLAARYASMLGLELAVSLHPIGNATRDKGHVALLERFRRRLPTTARWGTEVPIPIAGDARSADGMASIGPIEYLVEAETHLGDFQALERRIFAKARDIGADRVVLLLADTRHNRRLVDEVPGISERFPVDTRSWFLAVANANDPGGDALVIL
jgi:transcriptional regulator with XRE-family HTH domain